MKKDPGERKNLAKDPKYSKVLAEHRAMLDDYITRTKDDYRSMSPLRLNMNRMIRVCRCSWAILVRCLLVSLPAKELKRVKISLSSSLFFIIYFLLSISRTPGPSWLG